MYLQYNVNLETTFLKVHHGFTYIEQGWPKVKVNVKVKSNFFVTFYFYFEKKLLLLSYCLLLL